MLGYRVLRELLYDNSGSAREENSWSSRNPEVRNGYIRAGLDIKPCETVGTLEPPEVIDRMASRALDLVNVEHDYLHPEVIGPVRRF